MQVMSAVRTTAVGRIDGVENAGQVKSDVFEKFRFLAKSADRTW
jgi:hypothetical protein